MTHPWLPSIFTVIFTTKINHSYSPANPMDGWTTHFHSSFFPPDMIDFCIAPSCSPSIRRGCRLSEWGWFEVKKISSEVCWNRGKNGRQAHDDAVWGDCWVVCCFCNLGKMSMNSSVWPLHVFNFMDRYIEDMIVYHLQQNLSKCSVVGFLQCRLSALNNLHSVLQPCQLFGQAVVPSRTKRMANNVFLEFVSQLDIHIIRR